MITTSTTTHYLLLIHLIVHLFKMSFVKIKNDGGSPHDDGSHATRRGKIFDFLFDLFLTFSFIGCALQVV